MALVQSDTTSKRQVNAKEEGGERASAQSGRWGGAGAQPMIDRRNFESEGRKEGTRELPFQRDFIKERRSP